MTTTFTNLPPPVQTEFSEKMLSTPMPNLVHNLFSIPRSIKGNNGKTIRMRRYNRLQTAPVPVDPLFMNPAPEAVTINDIDSTINWYAKTAIVTREVTAINQDPKRLLQKAA